MKLYDWITNRGTLPLNTHTSSPTLCSPSERNGGNESFRLPAMRTSNQHVRGDSRFRRRFSRRFFLISISSRAVVVRQRISLARTSSLSGDRVASPDHQSQRNSFRTSVGYFCVVDTRAKSAVYSATSPRTAKFGKKATRTVS